MTIILNRLPKNKFCKSNIQFAFQFDVFLRSKLGTSNPGPFFDLCLLNASNESKIFYIFFLFSVIET